MKCIYDDLEYQIYYDLHNFEIYISSTSEELIIELNNKINKLDNQFLIYPNLLVEYICFFQMKNFFFCQYCKIFSTKQVCCEQYEVVSKFRLRRYEKDFKESIRILKSKVKSCEYCKVKLTPKNKNADHIFHLHQESDNSIHNIAIGMG